MNEQQIRYYIKKILEEGEEESTKEKKSPGRGHKKKVGKKIKVGEIGLSVGGGGFTKVVADAGALAKSNPKLLMTNLEIKGGGKGLDGVVKIWKQTMKQATMNKAYGGGISTITKGTRKGLKISTDQIGPRNGAKFLHHTLMGAKSAGLFSSDTPLQIQVVGDGVIVHTGENKGDWE